MSWFTRNTSRRTGQHSYTEVTRQGFGSKLSGSVGGMFFGFLIFVGSFAVLWFNEGRAVRTAKGLEEGLAEFVKIDYQNIDDSNDDKLVYAYGETSTDDILTDDEFGIEINALKLKRKVEMYQWKEFTKTRKEKKIGGGEETITDYTYKKVWSDKLINSNDFKLWEDHQNPSAKDYANYEIAASQIEFGEFTLENNIVQHFTSYEGFSLKGIDLTEYMNAKVITEKDNSLDKGNSIQKLYFGYGSNQNPALGDYKVSFQFIEIGDYSIIAKQTGDSFESYETSTGSTILLINEGKVSAKKMFDQAQGNNTILTWILRGVGIFMMYLGIMMMFNIVTTIANIIPFLGTLVNLGVSLFAGIISFALSLITIALAWIFYRPVLGAIILVAAVGIILFFYKRSLNKKSV